MSLTCGLRQLYTQAAARSSVAGVGHKRCLTYLSSCTHRAPSGSSRSVLLPSCRQRPRACRSRGNATLVASTGVVSPQQQSSAEVSEDSLDWDDEQAGSEPLLEGEIYLPAPTNTKIKTAEFVKSSTAVNQCPPENFPEFAVVGRSNVGKSSLINMLTGKKSLAMISKTPGMFSLHSLEQCCPP